MFHRRPPVTAFRVTPLDQAIYGRMESIFIVPIAMIGVQADGPAHRARMRSGCRASGIGITADTGYAEATGARSGAFQILRTKTLSRKDCVNLLRNGRGSEALSEPRA